MTTLRPPVGPPTGTGTLARYRASSLGMTTFSQPPLTLTGLRPPDVRARSRWRTPPRSTPLVGSVERGSRTIRCSLHETTREHCIYASASAAIIPAPRRAPRSCAHRLRHRGPRRCSTVARDSEYDPPLPRTALAQIPERNVREAVVSSADASRCRRRLSGKPRRPVLDRPISRRHRVRESSSHHA